MDLSNSVVLPREDFMELQEAAWNQTPPTIKDRLGNGIVLFIGTMTITAAVVVGQWSWQKAIDWRDEKSYQRTIREAEFKKNLDKK